MALVHRSLPEGVAVESLFHSQSVVNGGVGFILMRVANRFSRCHVFSFSSCTFWLCASLMSRVVLDISLLQRLGVIGIFFILIYSLYKVK